MGGKIRCPACAPSHIMSQAIVPRGPNTSLQVFFLRTEGTCTQPSVVTAYPDYSRITPCRQCLPRLLSNDPMSSKLTQITLEYPNVVTAYPAIRRGMLDKKISYLQEVRIYQWGCILRTEGTWGPLKQLPVPLLET